MTAGYLDTNILVGFFQGVVPIRHALERFDRLVVPAMTYAEFMAGLPDQKLRDASDQAIESLFEVIQSSKSICLEAAEIRRRIRLKMPDAMIYATARVGGGTLITLDKDFDKSWPDIYVPYEE